MTLKKNTSDEYLVILNYCLSTYLVPHLVADVQGEKKNKCNIKQNNVR